MLICSKGLDLDSLQKQNRFLFVDGLTGLYCPMDKDTAKSGDVFLQQGSVGATLDKAVAELARSSGRGKVVLVLDQMDAWLAMGEVSCMEALNLVTRLRENVHSLVMTVAADDALLHAQSTTLEREHAAFATTLAHEASCVMSLRLLDTGTADDVSGVLRITDADQGVEYLYHVGDAHRTAGGGLQYQFMMFAILYGSLMPASQYPLLGTFHGVGAG
ncbi:hypothetical protein AAL_07188 [Moelleriella libera RCEF 2490]|uniref:Uncharacterized protein n=1 Tax=Moelleriella libera RCEF 2490 TaxID=1081109 RepID=A0A167XV17_9HYPO|nr:hypothetical protein AAL_07188 [Moelleriella libera RCEF 2490]